jgi:hypothetical protein
MYCKEGSTHLAAARLGCGAGRTRLGAYIGNALRHVFDILRS